MKVCGNEFQTRVREVYLSLFSHRGQSEQKNPVTRGTRTEDFGPEGRVRLHSTIRTPPWYVCDELPNGE